MKKALLCATILGAALHFSARAQEEDPPTDGGIDSSRNFELIAQSYLQTALDIFPDDSATQARVHKMHGRWYNFWDTRVCLDVPDSVSIFAPAAMSAEYTFVQPWPEEGGGGIWDIDPEPPTYWPPLGDPYPPVCLANAGGNWNYLGPKYNTYGQAADRSGRITALWVSPADTKYILAGSAAGGLWKTTNGGQNWANITDNMSYLAMGTMGIAHIAVHPIGNDTIWLNTGLHTAITTFGMEGNKKYTTGFMFSTDGGATWKDDRAFKSKIQVLYPNDYMREKVYKLAFSPSTKKLYTAYRKRIFVRGNATTHTNDHNIWQNISPSGLNALSADYMITDFEFTTNPMGKIVFSTNNIGGVSYLFIYDEASSTWTQKTVNTPGYAHAPGAGHFEFGIMDLTLNNSDSAYMRMWAFTSPNNAVSRLYRTDLSTSGATVLVNGLLPTAAGALVISPSNPQTIYLTNNMGSNPFMHRSDDYGASFSNNMGANTHADGRCLILYSHNATSGGPNDVLFAGTDGGVAKRSSGGSAFYSLSGEGLHIAQSFDVHGAPTYEGILLTGTTDNGTESYISHRTGSQKWAEISGGDGTLAGFSRNGSLFSYSQNQSSFYRPRSYSLTSATVSQTGTDDQPADVDPNSKWMRPVKFDRYNNARTAFYFIWRNTAAISTMSWSPAFGSMIAPGEPKPIAVNDPADTIKVYKYTRDFIVADQDTSIAYIAYGRTLGMQDSAAAYNLSAGNKHGRLYFTEDAGLTWHNRTPPKLVNSQINSIDIDQSNPSRIWVAYGNVRWGELNKPATDRTRRVMYSPSAGQTGTWVDMSKGLPPVPVNEIVYVQGSGNVLFAGTDIGVYRWNHAAQQWECFNNGLPRGLVHGLEMHYCSGKLRAAMYGRGIYETDWKPNQNHFGDIAGFTNEVNNNETWTTDRDIDGSIHVKPGKTLTIDGATIYMARNARILVDRNAILELKNGAKLTNGCTGVTWSGIEVAGNLAFGQSDKPSKGWLKISGNSIIENARIGVADYTATYGNEGGGYMQINGATFLNCYRGIALNNYPVFQNRCQFNNITFTTDNSYYVPEHVNEPRFFTSWNEKGFSITNSTFQDLRSSVHMDKRFTGVHTGNSGYTVQNCDFTKLRRGVNAINELDLPDRTVYVRNCDFDTLKEGVNIVKLSGGIYNNNFTFHNTVTTSAGINNSLWQKEWGIMLDHWRGTLVQDNTVTGKPATNTNPLQHGIVSSSLDYTNNHVANLSFNTLHRLFAGVQTQGRQQRTYIFCNALTGSGFGISINPQSPTGILNNQGSGLNADTENRPSNTFAGTSVPILHAMNPNTVNYYATTDLPNTVPSFVWDIYSTFNLITGTLTGSGNEASCVRLMAEPDNSTWVSVGDAVTDFGTLVSNGHRHTDEAVALYNWILMAYSKWDTTDNATHIRTFLEADNHDDSRLMLAGLYYNLGETELISGILAGLEEMHTDEVTALQDYYSLLLALKSSERQMNGLDSTELVTLNAWAASESYISPFAKAWLETHYDSVWMHHVEDLPVIDISANIKMDNQGSALGNATPNPADRTTTVQVFVAPSDAGRKPTLVLRDVMGREYFRKALDNGYNHVEISTAKLPPGIYVYSLVVNDKEKEGKKLSIAR